LNRHYPPILVSGAATSKTARGQKIVLDPTEEPVGWSETPVALHDSSDASSPNLMLVTELHNQHQYHNGVDAAQGQHNETAIVESRMEIMAINGNSRFCQDSESRNTDPPVIRYQNKLATSCNGRMAMAIHHNHTDNHLPNGRVAETKSLDDTDLTFMLPEMLSDFQSQLYTLQGAIRKDNEEMESLRLQNEYLRKQLSERDQIIESLQRQLRGVP